MKRLLLGPLVLLCYVASAQVVTIKEVELSGEKIVVTYDLDDNNPNNEYLLNLYTSKDNYAQAVANVTGDIGMDIKPGTDKKVEWNLVKEYGGYKGRLALELRGKVYVPFIRLKDFKATGTYRRGKTYNLNWKAGNSDPVNIELYKGGQRITGEMNHPNNGSYDLYIPSHAKPGTDYKIKFTDARSSDENFATQTFRVRPKIPLLLKILPVAVVGTVIFILTSKGGSKGEGGGGDDIPDPAFPPKQ
ncbi:MAG: hypothetical protein WDO15_12925 [Bacteroidota bacterium]